MIDKKAVTDGVTPLSALNMIKQKLGLDKVITCADGQRKDPIKLVSIVFWYQYKLGDGS